VWELESDAAQDQLSDLVKFSLVEWNAETSRYRLHDLARVFANSRLSQAERDNAKRQHAKYYKAVIDEAGALYEKGGEAIKRGLELFDTDWVNIQAGQAWAVSQAESDNEAVQLCIDYPDCGAYVISLRLYPRERIRWLEPALKAAQQLKRPVSEGFALANLGVAHRHLGETHKAIEFLEQALVVSCEIGDHGSKGFALSNLGNAYYDLGEMQKAIGFHEQALSIRQEISDRGIESYILCNIGIAYRNLGETRKAIEFLEQALRIHREINDHRGEGFDLGNLGKAYADLGETRKAIEFLEQALIIRREIGDRRGEGFNLWYLSLTLDKLGERAKALELAEASLKIREDIEDPGAEEVRKKLAEWRGQK
jgi:tetratricopeptide (TPR) repeat protein